ncbi:MAG TPA: flagellar motor switch protein FliN [Bryobacteraceae bacterium]|nr:flagellar motor switch protein FliN [Bryobacteraceae bacterium]
MAQALEMMTGESYTVTPGARRKGSSPGLLWWVQHFERPSGRVLAAGAEQHVWLEIGTRVLQGSGVDLVNAAEAQATWFELVQQATGGAVRAVTVAGGKLETGSGKEGSPPDSDSDWFDVGISAPDGTELSIVIAASPDLLAAEAPPAVAKTAQNLPAAAPPRAVAPIQNAAPAAAFSGAASRTMDALLDVELQVSISFGQTVLPLKDVLKLTTGTVVELNRLPEEPVDVIVNDCVVARGEVVVVDGNYAVRVQDIISRQQRLGLSGDRAHGSRGGL